MIVCDREVTSSCRVQVSTAVVVTAAIVVAVFVVVATVVAVVAIVPAAVKAPTNTPRPTSIHDHLSLAVSSAQRPRSTHFINNTIRDSLDVFYTASLDDILIYSDTLGENKKHVRIVMERRSAAASTSSMYRRPITWNWPSPRRGLRCKTERWLPSGAGWPAEPHRPATLPGVREFLSLIYPKPLGNGRADTANESRGHGCGPLPQATAFQALRGTSTSAPIQQHSDYGKEAMVETGASDYVLAGALSQLDGTGASAL